MTPAEWNRLQELFHEAAEGTEQVRSAMLRTAAAESASIERELRNLLEAHGRKTDFLEPIGLENESALPTGDVPGHRMGPYVITRLIAAGGMGAVYEAIEEPLGRSVAIKVLHALGTGPASLRRFEREARVLAMLKHPGIAAIYHFGVHREPRLREGASQLGFAHPFIAMEFVANARTITQYATDVGLLRRARLELLLQACDAVHHGHQRAIIHRDLKPGNILVDGDGVVKVIDFGIARIADESGAVEHRHTMDGRLFGTLQYMSPEQCLTEGGVVDFRSDVYSLGVVLFELICGRPPIDLRGADLAAAMRLILSADPVRPTIIDRSVSADLEAVLLKSVAREANHRYQTAADLSQDIRRYLAGDPVSARTPSLHARARAFVRKHRTPVVAALAVAAVLATASVVGTWLAIRADSRARAALRAQHAAAEQLARTERTVEFLRGALASSNPLLSGRTPPDLTASTFEPWADWRSTPWAFAGKSGMAATTIDVLAAAGERLPVAFAEDAASRAKLADTLGWTLFRLRAFDKAEPLLRDAVAAYRQSVGEDHPDTIAAMLHLGELLDGTGGSEEGRRWFEQAHSLATGRFGPHDARTLRVVWMLAWCLQFNLREETQALELLARTYADACDSGAALKPEVLELAVRLAVAKHAAGDRRGAAEIAEHAHQRLTEVVGSADPRTATAALEWGRMLSDVPERCTQAAGLLEQAVTARGRVFGADSLERAQALSWLAHILEQAGEIDRAIAARREHADTSFRMLGSADFETRNARLDLARMLIRRGAGTDAEGVALAKGLIEQSDDPTSVADDVVVVARIMIVDHLRARGEYTEAMLAAEGLLRAMRQNGASARPQRVLDVHVRLVEWLIEARRTDEAAARVQELESWAASCLHDPTMIARADAAVLRLSRKCREGGAK